MNVFKEDDQDKLEVKTKQNEKAVEISAQRKAVAVDEIEVDAQRKYVHEYLEGMVVKFLIRILLR